MTDLATQLVTEFTRRGLTLATCESLTGGMIGAAITAVAGSSSIYRGGLITYASDLKVSLAGVDAAWVDAHGVVNEQAAVAMATSVRHQCDSSYAVACTGVAGPTAQDDQPVGTVWLAIAIDLPGAENPVLTRRLELSGDRASIREQTTTAALTWLLDLLSPFDR